VGKGLTISEQILTRI